MYYTSPLAYWYKVYQLPAMAEREARDRFSRIVGKQASSLRGAYRLPLIN